MKNLTPLLVALTVAITLPAFAADTKAAAGTQEIKGEIVDLVCYLDHGAKGEKHAKCAAGCIDSGLPVGIKSESGTIYLVVGDHKPLNKELAPLAGKQVTLRGKAVTRDGVNLLENAVVVK